MEKIIIEVGSTVTKIDKFEDGKVKRLGDKAILFKKNYLKDKKLRKSDIDELILTVNEIKEKYNDVYVCGTSIFRTLNEEEKKKFLKEFKGKTNLDFHIISVEEENKLTVLGSVKNVKSKVCVFVGGGGSTEISIYDKKIIENVNTPIGVMDVMEKFPNLADDIAKTSVEEVKKYIKERLNLPKGKADILILSGGGHEKFARYSGIKYEKNTLYSDQNEPIMMDIETRKRETERYFKEISLNEIRNRSKDPNWWDATRAMCAFSLVVAEEIEAKYIIPTDISMAYGIE